MNKLTALLLLIFAFTPAFAQDNTQDADTVAPQTLRGKFRLEGLPIEVNLPEGYEFANARGTKWFLTEKCKEDSAQYADVAGMIFTHFASGTGEIETYWLLRYYESGHVVDKDVDRIDFDEVLTEIRDGGHFDDFDEITWAWAPSYDKSQHRLTMPMGFYAKSVQSTGFSQFIFGKDVTLLIEPYGLIYPDGRTAAEGELVAKSISYLPGARYEDYKKDADDDVEAWDSVLNFIRGWYCVSDNNGINILKYKGLWFFNLKVFKVMVKISAGLAALALVLLLMVGVTSSKRKSPRFGVNGMLRFTFFIAVYLLFYVLHLMSIWAIVAGLIMLDAGITLIAQIAGWIMLAVYILVKIDFVFASPEKSPGAVEVTEQQAPRLFALIAEVAAACGKSMPKHVYVSAFTNCRLTVKRSIWRLYRPEIYSIEIGIGLLEGLNSCELKALIAGEYGKTVKRPGGDDTRRYRCYRIVNTLCSSDVDPYELRLLGKISRIVCRGNIPAKNIDVDTCLRLSARIAGKKATISVLYKLEIIERRFGMFMDIVSDIQERKKQVPKQIQRAYAWYFARSRYIDDAIVESSIFVNAPLKFKPESRLNIDAPWFMQMSVDEMVAFVRTLPNGADVCVPGNITDFIPDEVCDMVSEKLNTDKESKGFTVSNEHEYNDLLDGYIATHTLPVQMLPFLGRDIIPMRLGAAEEVGAEHITDDIFNDEIAQYLSTYEQALAEYNAAQQFMDVKSHNHSIQYQGVVYGRKSFPFEVLRERVETMSRRAASIDKAVYLYALAHTSNKQAVRRAYDDIFYAQATLARIDKEVHPIVASLIPLLNKDGHLTKSEAREAVKLLNKLQETLLPIFNTLEINRLSPVTDEDFDAKIKRTIAEHMLDSKDLDSEKASFILNLIVTINNALSELSHHSKNVIASAIIFECG